MKPGVSWQAGVHEGVGLALRRAFSVRTTGQVGRARSASTAGGERAAGVESSFIIWMVTW